MRLNPARRRLTNKLSWIKKLYDEAAKQYFLAHPACEECGEERMCCLGIHHPEGKKVEKFKTLCQNCHAVEHSGAWTVGEALGPVV